MSSFVTSDGARIRYKDAGDGPTVIFIHGWCMSSAVWAGVAARMTTSYRTISLDLRGHGSSSAGGECTIAVFARDIAELFDHLHLDTATVVGWSMGGEVALAAAPLLGKHLSSLVLVATTPRFTAAGDFPHAVPATETRGMALRLRRDYRGTMEYFFNGMFTADERETCDSSALLYQLGNQPLPPAEVALEVLASLAATDLRPLLKDIDAPVLLVHGERDTICLSGASRFMAEVIPDATLRLLPAAGHAPHLSHPEEFSSLLIHFLARHHATH